MGEGKTICLSFCLIVNPAIRSNVIIQFRVWFVCPSVYQFVYCLSMCPSIRPSVKCKSACMRIQVADLCYSVGLYVFFSFVGPSIHPVCRRSVSLNAIF